MIFLDIVQFEVFSRCVNLCAIIFYHSGSGIKFAKHFHRFCCQFEWLEASFQNARLLETLMKVRDKNPSLINTTELVTARAYRESFVEAWRYTRALFDIKKATTGQEKYSKKTDH